MRRHKGLFITFEKTKEGLGGSTQAKLLQERLLSAGYSVILTREPGGTPLGEQIRDILLDPHRDLSRATELFLFMAMRAQHYKDILKPALKAGSIVICDRYFDSSLVYQGSGQGWKSALLYRLHHAATGSLFPDLTFVMDGQPFRERDETDRMEALGDSFHERVERGMRHIATKSDRYEIITVDADASTISDRIFDVIQSRELLTKLRAETRSSE